MFEGCGGEMTSAEGSIISPNYPLPYPHDGECFWTITVASGNALRITFDDLQMEGNPQCTYDYVMVRAFIHSPDFPLVKRCPNFHDFGNLFAIFCSNANVIKTSVFNHMCEFHIRFDGCMTYSCGITRPAVRFSASTADRHVRSR